MSDGNFLRTHTVQLALLTLGVLTFAVPVRAGVLEFQTQTEYDFSQIKKKGSSATGLGRFSTDYTLTLRRPFLPTSTLMSDLTFKAVDSGDSNISQNARGWTLNLYSTEPKYMLNSRISHTTYGTSSGQAASATGTTTNYNADLFLRQPAYPAVSVQFQRQVSGSNFAGTSGSYTTTSWLMSSYYDLLPLRFSIDRSRQMFDYSGSSSIQTNSQTSAVTLNRSLTSGLTIFGELSRSGTDVAYANNSSSNDINRRVLRLTATPMRSVVAELALESEADRQKVGLLEGRNNNTSVSWSVRSEILPGLSFDAGDEKQTQSGREFLGYPGSVSRVRNLALTARLSDAAIFNVASTRSYYDVSSSVYQATEDSLQSSLQTNLSRTTDFSLNYGRSKSSAGAGDLFDNTVEGASIRDRTSSKLSVGATYRLNRVRSRVAGADSLEQHGDSTDLDVSWQPRYDIGLDLRVSNQNNRGVGAFRSLAPSGNVRWQLDSSTNLTANYSLQRYRQFDPANVGLLGQDTRGLSIRMIHSFARGANLDLSYDFQASNITDIEWHRQLRLGFTYSPSSR